MPAIPAPPGVRGHGSPFFKLLLKLVCHENNVSVQSQAAEAVRIILDVHTFEGCGIDKEEFLNVFYEQGIVEILAEPLRTNLNMSPDAPECVYYARQLICDLIGFCVENHSYRMKFFMLRQNIAVRVAKLCVAPQKYVAVAALRCLRTVCASKDEFYHRSLSQKDAFKIPLKVFEYVLHHHVDMFQMSIIEACLKKFVSKSSPILCFLHSTGIICHFMTHCGI
jgi:protein phosphatase-4 regulatory subunit 3